MITLTYVLVNQFRAEGFKEPVEELQKMYDDTRAYLLEMMPGFAFSQKYVVNFVASRMLQEMSAVAGKVNDGYRLDWLKQDDIEVGCIIYHYTGKVYEVVVLGDYKETIGRLIHIVGYREWQKPNAPVEFRPVYELAAGSGTGGGQPRFAKLIKI